MAVPICLILIYSIFQRGQFGGVVFHATTENFTRALDPVYRSVLFDSLKIASITTVLALALGYPTAYGIAKLPKRFRTTALLLIVMPFWTNFLIRTYSWIMLLNSEGLLNKALLKLNLIHSPLDLLYTQSAVILGLLYGYLPLMILPLYASIEKLDPEIREAASNLGANRFRTFLDVTLPLTISGVLAGSIFVFIPSLGNFIVPELLGGGKTVMVGNLIRDQFLKARDWPFGSVLALVVIFLVFVLFALQSKVEKRISGDAHAN
ncbi:MAG: ABC transporter permease [Streptomycetaceae bacterium]|nr:MAG: ABC transporter permease [Streptomycetaceae bacterium]